jgi:hypothetical protein
VRVVDEERLEALTGIELAIGYDEPAEQRPEARLPKKLQSIQKARAALRAER